MTMTRAEWDRFQMAIARRLRPDWGLHYVSAGMPWRVHHSGQRITQPVRHDTRTIGGSSNGKLITDKSL